MSMIEVLSTPLFQRSILAGVLVGIIAGYLGVFVVQRGLSFLGSGLAHAAFGGVALALLLDKEPMLVALPFTIVVSLAISFLKEKTILASDTLIGILFSLSVALGVVFLSMRKSYSADAMSYLFGSILTVSKTDIRITLGVLLFIILLLPLWGRWAYTTFDRKLSVCDSVPTLFDDRLLSVVIAVAVVVAIKVAGIILIAAFLVIPAASARLAASTFKMMTILSIMIGAFSSIAGFFFSYYADIPSGSAVIIIQSLIFIILFFAGKKIRL